MGFFMLVIGRLLVKEIEDFVHSLITDMSYLSYQIKVSARK